MLSYLSLLFFSVENFDAKNFFGCKFSGLCTFWGLQYEAPSDSPHPVMHAIIPPERVYSHVIGLMVAFFLTSIIIMVTTK